jgi:23S rRNA pseudouridine1911/1915/1917 synthase
MKTEKIFIVKKISNKERLDVFLSKKLKISRSQIQKIIDNEQILINNKKPKKYGEEIKEGDKIACHCEPRYKSGRSNPIIKKETSLIKTSEPILPVKIIADTPNYLIVEKPSGMLTHPTQAEEKNTLADWLVKKYPEIKKIGEDKARPGIVHRLDKEASGLLVVARTQKMFNHLKNQFKKRQINKEYIVLVHGRVAKDWDEINFPISRSETADKMAAIPLTYRGYSRNLEAKPCTDSRSESGAWGKEAKTEFFVEKRFVNFTLLKVIIHTGRMHQIRAHMLAYNSPVVGDPLYFQKKQKRIWDELCGRLFLHSAKLGIKELDGKYVEFESPLPEQLQNFLKIIK